MEVKTLDDAEYQEIAFLHVLTHELLPQLRSSVEASVCQVRGCPPNLLKANEEAILSSLLAASISEKANNIQQLTILTSPQESFDSLFNLVKKRSASRHCAQPTASLPPKKRFYSLFGGPILFPNALNLSQQS